MADRRILDLGAQDPELENSPIETHGNPDDEFSEAAPIDEEFCIYNGNRYPSGTYVRSGTAVLRCEHGVWVDSAPSDPANP